MINELIIEGTPKTPHIDLNHLTGNLILSGKSIPENAAKVYEPVLNWVSKYVLEANPITNFRFALDYYNTSTTLWVTKILKELIKIKEPDYALIVHLYLPIEDFDEVNDFEDIKDAFLPISNIEQNAMPSIGIKLYGTGDQFEVIKETFVFIEKAEYTK
jgi:hypothetical protein